MKCPNCRYDGGSFAVVRSEATDIGINGFLSGAMTLVSKGSEGKPTRIYFCSICGVSFIETEQNCR